MWEQTGNKAGNTGNILLSHHLPIPPFEPVTLAFPVPHPTLRPKASGGTNLICLRPLRLRLVDTFLQDLRNCCGLFSLQPRSNHLLPWITFVARLLLIVCQLYQVWGVCLLYTSDAADE